MRENGYTAIPVDKTEQGHLVLTVRLNGRKAQCTIDTGFTYSAADRARAGKLPPLDRTDPELELPRAAFGKSNQVWSKIGHLDLGGYRVQNVPVQSVDMATANRRGWFARMLEGKEMFESELVLGADFLKRHHAVIEYQSTPILYLRPKSLETPTQAAFERTLTNFGFLPIRLYHLETLGWVAPAHFDGVKVPLLVDTGAGHTLLDLAFVEQMGLKTLDSARQILGVEGRKTPLKIAQFQEAQLGEFTIPKPRVGVADLSQWNLSRTNHSVFQPRGLIGSEFFSKTHAIIDCDNQKIWCWTGR
jgi:predicted aspartyl protease